MFLIALLALSGATPPAAQAGPAVPPHRWTVDYSRMSCTLARRVGEEGSAIVAFNARLGEEPGELLVLDGGTGVDPRLDGYLSVRLDDGPPLVLHATHERRNDRQVVKLRPTPDDFLTRVAAARALVIGNGQDPVLSLAMPDAHGAVDALTRCNDDLLQSWGIDLAARRGLRREPRIRNYDWASDIHPSADTFLVFASEVSETGEPLDCRVVVSSGNARMDNAVCALVRRNARFNPGLDSAGRPTRAQYANIIRWIVPTD